MNFNLRALFRNTTSLQEATEKKDTAKLAGLGLLGAAIVFTVLSALLHIDFLESLGMIAIVAAAVCFYFWYRA